MKKWRIVLLLLLCTAVAVPTERNNWWIFPASAYAASDIFVKIIFSWWKNSCVWNWILAWQLIRAWKISGNRSIIFTMAYSVALLISCCLYFLLLLLLLCQESQLWLIFQMKYKAIINIKWIWSMKLCQLIYAHARDTTLSNIHTGIKLLLIKL